MKRIDTTNKYTDKFGAGKHGWRDGDKANGIAATEFNASIMDVIQEEAVAIAEMSGATLDATGANKTQCRDAIIAYVQSQLNNGASVLIVRAASTVAINLAAPGANIDGVAMNAGESFLEKDHGTGSSRGVYIWNGAATPATRDPRADTGAELKAGMLFVVTEGTINADSIWELDTNGTVTVGTTPQSYTRKDYVSPQSQAHFSTIINGDCRVATKAAPNLSTTAQYGKVDMFAFWATGTAVSAGTITQDTAAPIGVEGIAAHVSGATITGSGVVFGRYRQNGANSKNFKNKTGSFGVMVHHDVGSSINYTVTIRKANSLDNFGATTTIATGSAQAVPNTTATLVKFENVSMGDCSNGWEMEVSAACGAVTTKNFKFTEWRAVRGATLPTDMLPRSIGDDKRECRAFVRMINEFQTADRFSSARAFTTVTARAIYKFDSPMQSAPTFTALGTNNNFNIEYGNGSAASATSTPTLSSADRNGVDVAFGCAAVLTANFPLTISAQGDAQILLEANL